jgi:hypothetical protein
MVILPESVGKAGQVTQTAPTQAIQPGQPGAVPQPVQRVTADPDTTN